MAMMCGNARTIGTDKKLSIDPASQGGNSGILIRKVITWWSISAYRNLQKLKPIVELLKSQVLTDFPSGSSINYRDGKLYLIGDDARNILILDTDYRQIDSIQLLDFPGKRIPKPVKPDLEGSTFATIRSSVLFLIIGSASTKKREKLFVIPFLESGLDVSHHFVFDTSNLVAGLKEGGIQEVNMEGITVVDDHLY